MASPTLIEVSTDDTEYSRYEHGREIVTATVILSGGGTYTNEEVTVEFVKARRARDVAVASIILTFNGAAPQSQTAAFDIRNIVDSDLYNLVRRGDYFIRARSVSNTNIFGESADFAVRIMTIQKFKDDYLFGLRLMATEIKAVKFQPVSITGVEVTEVSKGSIAGFGTLTHIYQTSPVRHLLSWKNGPQVLIPGPGTYILRAGSTAPGVCTSSILGEYIVVRVKSLALLPTTTIMEDLLIEEKSMNDSTIADYLERSASWIENDLLHIYLEPTYLVTERDPTTIQFADPGGINQALFTIVDYDYVVNPLTYFSPKRGTWITIYTPYMRLLRCDSLYGALGNTRVLEIDLNWIQVTMAGGMIQLVPYNSSIAFTYLGLIWSSSLVNLAELPNFWRFALLAGIPQATPDLIELMAKKAAIDALTVLGAALRPGLGSVSLSRDGVSESYSLANSKYGNLSGAIQSYRDWMEMELPRYKAKYRGAVIKVV